MITDNRLLVFEESLNKGYGPNPEGIRELISEVRRLRGIIRNGYKTDPGDSDLDDEQPIVVWTTLGEFRRAGW